jgi:hypothetical protein
MLAAITAIAAVATLVVAGGLLFTTQSRPTHSGRSGVWPAIAVSDGQRERG